jgi:hypothetical protein
LNGVEDDAARAPRARKTVRSVAMRSVSAVPGEKEGTAEAVAARPKAKPAGMVKGRTGTEGGNGGGADMMHSPVRERRHTYTQRVEREREESSECAAVQQRASASSRLSEERRKREGQQAVATCRSNSGNSCVCVCVCAYLVCVCSENVCVSE